MKVRLKIGIAALALSLFVACSNKKETVHERKIIPVKVMNVESQQTALQQKYVGTVEESVAVSLSFSGTGTVERIFVTEGQRVAKGQLLATLNTATAQNAYNISQAKLSQAQDAYDRLAKVHENGSLADIKFSEVEAGLQQAKSMAAISKKSLDDCKMYAPRSGVIASRNVEVGASAVPGMAAFKLVSVDKVYVKIPIPENEIGGIKEGQNALVEVPALDNAQFTGKIEMKGVIANAMSHTYEVKIGINNPQTKLMPGMVCKVRLNESKTLSGIVVPNGVVQISHDGNHFVWIVEKNAAKRRFVSIGDLTDYGVMITGGLSANEQIIVEGYTKVSENMNVSIVK